MVCGVKKEIYLHFILLETGRTLSYFAMELIRNTTRLTCQCFPVREEKKWRNFELNKKKGVEKFKSHLKTY